ncbi:hypothetical protein MKX03_005749 [Papaver bracteatum]|nr:hypothetical protein MKX03_005749 [Papaver bracteatum]
MNLLLILDKSRLKSAVRFYPIFNRFYFCVEERELGLLLRRRRAFLNRNGWRIGKERRISNGFEWLGYDKDIHA